MAKEKDKEKETITDNSDPRKYHACGHDMNYNLLDKFQEPNGEEDGK